jgi:hypothetical protein
LLAGAGIRLFGQTETGQISRTVADPTGATLPGAKITVRSVGTGATRSATTSNEGTYNVTNLLPGDYMVTVNASGFAQNERKVTVAVGSRVGQDFRLSVAAEATTVEVTESTAQVNTESQTLSQVVTEHQILQRQAILPCTVEHRRLTSDISVWREATIRSLLLTGRDSELRQSCIRPVQTTGFASGRQPRSHGYRI